MKPPNYPYPTMDEDGFELQLLDEGLPDVAPDTERFEAKPGDTVKLVFVYKNPVRNHGLYGSERMWVEIIRQADACLIGRLDSSPQFTDLLKSDAIIHFHPRHILNFWKPPT
jgi:hypothetical protein